MFTKSDNGSEGHDDGLVRILEESLSEIFTENGKKTVLFYLKHRYDVTPEDVVINPAKFSEAMEAILGDLGSSIVQDWVYRRARSRMKLGQESGYDYLERKATVTLPRRQTPVRGLDSLNLF